MTANLISYKRYKLVRPIPSHYGLAKGHLYNSVPYPWYRGTSIQPHYIEICILHPKEDSERQKINREHRYRLDEFRFSLFDNYPTVTLLHPVKKDRPTTLYTSLGKDWVAVYWKRHTLRTVEGIHDEVIAHVVPLPYDRQYAVIFVRDDCIAEWLGVKGPRCPMPIDILADWLQEQDTLVYETASERLREIIAYPVPIMVDMEKSEYRQHIYPDTL